MEDLLAKMQEILGSEEGREQLKSVAQMLGGNPESMPNLSNIENLLGNSQNTPPQQGAVQTSNPAFDLSKIDINMIMNIQKILGNMNQEDDTTRLLLALKPHFSQARRDKIDKAIKILHLLSVLPLLKDSGILGGLFGNDWKL